VHTVDDAQSDGDGLLPQVVAGSKDVVTQGKTSSGHGEQAGAPDGEVGEEQAQGGTDQQKDFVPECNTV